MQRINYILILVLSSLLFSCGEKEDISNHVVGVWETDWSDILEGDLDEMTVNEIIAFDDDGTFRQIFTGSVEFDDWENETDVDYAVETEGTWRIENKNNIVLQYDMNQFAMMIGKSSIEGDYTDAAIGLLTGDLGGVLSGIIKGGNTDKLNKKVEAEMEKQISKYFKEMFREMNKDKKAFTNVKINDNTLSADINHGFFGRSAVYDNKHLSASGQAATTNNSTANKDWIVEFEGYIGNYPIKMYLNLKDIDNYDWCEVEGKYCYTSSGSGQYLALYGVKQGETLELSEYNDDGDVTGTFDGKFEIFGRLASFEYNGTFTNYKGKTFEFSLSSH